MSVSDVVILCILAAMVAFIIHYLVKQHKSGKTFCEGDCSSCFGKCNLQDEAKGKVRQSGSF